MTDAAVYCLWFIAFALGMAAGAFLALWASRSSDDIAIDDWRRARTALRRLHR